MTITNQEEYKLPNGQTVSIQLSVETNRWEVACWNDNDNFHWYKEFDNEPDAKALFNRWKS